MFTSQLFDYFNNDPDKNPDECRFHEIECAANLPEDNDQIFAGQYQTVLPDKQTFINLLIEIDV